MIRTKDSLGTPREFFVILSIMQQQQRRILIAAVVLIWVILMLQIAAQIWYLYWVLDWYDNVMHFLGGVWLGLLIYALFSRRYAELFRYKVLMILFVVSGTLLIGFLWEGMEFFLDLILGTNTFQPDLPDTMSDLALDMLGSIVATFGILIAGRK